jgi:hypothetical protein
MSLAPEANDSLHVYEIRADGAGLRRLTSGRYHDVHPIALPGGKIAFVSTRVEAYSMCQPGAAEPQTKGTADDADDVEIRVICGHFVARGSRGISYVRDNRSRSVLIRERLGVPYPESVTLTFVRLPARQSFGTTDEHR